MGIGASQNILAYPQQTNDADTLEKNWGVLSIATLHHWSV
jgi:hypothetical protein